MIREAIHRLPDFFAHFIELRIAPPLSHRRHAPVIPPSEIAAKPRTTC
jgi:hypothetical protein